MESIPSISGSHSQQESEIRYSRGEWGLTLLSCPPNPLVDLIFVHGLAGGSVKTWCYSKDAASFWPQKWLPKERGFKDVRIYSYGYDAEWEFLRGSPNSNITDFGNQLLESLGGLVVKQPGSSLAPILNKILCVLPLHSKRCYVSNLDTDNGLLSSLKLSFSQCVSGVSLYSFYESKPVHTGVWSVTIVKKSSAIMGIPGEEHAMLDANHMKMCKFKSRKDSNYQSVRNALRYRIKKILRDLSPNNDEDKWRAMQGIEEFLAAPVKPDSDLKNLEESRVEGSCEWLTERKAFRKWANLNSENTSMVYWISGRPATGKSVLSAHVIKALADTKRKCYFFFFKRGDEQTSTVSGCLLSLLYQMAFKSNGVRQQLLSMMNRGKRFDKHSANEIWRNLLLPIIARKKTDLVRYLVLDALDECSGCECIFTMIAALEGVFGIRIMITSRQVPFIGETLSKLSNRTNSISVLETAISPEVTKSDIRLYIEANKHKVNVGDEEQKNNFIKRIIEKSDGCFLWVRLVLDELASTWSLREAERVLDDLPQGMSPFYLRAIDSMSSEHPDNQRLIRAILTWVVCSVRPLTVAELTEALKLDINDEVPELDKAIASLCAQLLHVDQSGRVMMAHFTAKTFLVDVVNSKFRIRLDDGHLQLAATCLRLLCLGQPEVWSNRRQRFNSRSSFAQYAALEFAEHLNNASSASPGIEAMLYDFLQSDVLSWVEFVALNGDLSILVKTADSICEYALRRIQSPPAMVELARLAQNWKTDLHQMIVDFGQNLLACPSAIHSIIPAFYSESSVIGAKSTSNFTVRSFENKGLINYGACIDSMDQHATVFTCGSTFLAVGYTNGSIILYENNTYLPWKTLEHCGPVYHLLFNGDGTHVVSACSRYVMIWDIYRQHNADSLTPSSFIFNSKKDNHTLAAFYNTDRNGIICIYDYKNRTLLQSALSSFGIAAGACSQDGQILAIEAELFHLANRGTSLIGPEELGTNINDINLAYGNVISVCIDGPGRFVFAGRNDGSVTIHDTVAGGCVLLCRHHHAVVSCIFGSQRNIFVSHSTKDFRVWSLAGDQEFGWSAKRLMRKKLDGTMQHRLLLDPSNRFLLVATRDGLNIWHVDTGELTSEWNISLQRFRRSPVPVAQRIQKVTMISRGDSLILAIQFLSTSRDNLGMTEAAIIWMDSAQISRYSVHVTAPLRIEREIRYVVGSYESKLIFVDRSDWVSSVDFGNWVDLAYYTRHFPIPPSWSISGGDLGTSMGVNGNGNVWFVHGDEVYVDLDILNIKIHHTISQLLRKHLDDYYILSHTRSTVRPLSDHVYGDTNEILTILYLQVSKDQQKG
ncbi:uncharacterized protein TRIVIDRAFT_67162 [Trichoderma virens Gv29-8]|uniref:NACHT domain-containing protein n=1 Tax=Hypocrea virens (strain Gv29-8 / FGSC 10586) TaxID=413071 RepID=G9N594_HYPVG|nr:uncharacterized protein TRIVIDRAFT_67162 [Trichoderma virens Gv29-8]EHK17939.1 hypothetical protein TRIVIDRAFT_67162 [Trichoderma virens Gv29-8]UKZ54196.1 hypothetical protein TrVGV298_008003 [Trichoderma virens]